MRVFNQLTFLLALVLTAHALAGEGGKYALLVGVSTYRSDSGLGDLQYPESDMIALKQALVETGFEDFNVRLMVNSSKDARLHPERENVLNELKLILTGKGKDDIVLVMLAGHGLQPREKNNAYFCPSNARLTQENTWLDLNTIFSMLKESEAGGKLLIADCCRDDPKLKNIRGLPLDVESLTRPAKLKPPQNVAALFSCNNGEVSFEEKELGGGVFTHFLMKGLRGKAAFNDEIEVKTLASYLQRNVRDYVAAKRGSLQQPAFMMESDKPLVLAKITARAVPTPPPPGNAIVPEANTGNELTLDLGGGVKVELVYVKAGQFQMGADGADSSLHGSEPVHMVRISKPFLIGKHPITVAQFRRFVAATGYKTDAEKEGKGITLVNNDFKETDGASWKNPGFSQDEDHPVGLVSWNDAQEFMKWACTKTGRSVALPSEAQWEYAARGANSLKYPWGNAWDGTKANHADLTLKNSGKGGDGWFWNYTNERDGFVFTSPVGHFKNASWCGALDMSGNVWQLCQDAFDAKYYGISKTNDPLNTEGASRVLRGGSWRNSPLGCRGSDRAWSKPGSGDVIVGFRVVVAPSSRTP